MRSFEINEGPNNYIPRRNNMKFTWWIIPALLFVVGCQSSLKERKTIMAGPRPNFIIIMADDLGYGDLGCYGNKKIKTPNIDALAKAGVRFVDFHSNGAVCSPTRAALLTGRYQQRAGIEGVITAKNHRKEGLALEEVTFAEVFRQAGYTNAIIGKWHLGYDSKLNPVHQGFDFFRGFVSGNVDYQSHIDQEGYADWWADTVLTKEAGYSTDLITQYGVKFIQENRQKPFCLYLAHEAPHSPYQGPHDPAERTVGGRFQIQGSRPDKLAAYKEMVEAMDEGIGQIVKTVKALGMEQNTFIFFLSDNGANNIGSNAPFSGHKGQLLEGGHRVPAIAYWPNHLKPGTESELLLMSMDLFPTMAAAAGIELPESLKLDGINFLPWLKGEVKPADRPVFWRTDREKAVRQGNWKLLVNKQTNKIKLYDLSQGMNEENDVSAGNAGKVKMLMQQLSGWESGLTKIRMKS